MNNYQTQTQKTSDETVIFEESENAISITSVRITLLATYRVTHRFHKRIIDTVK